MILEGRWLDVRTWSGHISSSSSAVLLCHPSRFGRLSLPSLYSFCIYGRIWLLSPLDIFVLALLKRFESLANDRDSLFAFIFISTGLSAAIR